MFVFLFYSNLKFWNSVRGTLMFYIKAHTNILLNGLKKPTKKWNRLTIHTRVPYHFSINPYMRHWGTAPRIVTLPLRMKGVILFTLQAALLLSGKRPSYPSEYKNRRILSCSGRGGSEKILYWKPNSNREIHSLSHSSDRLVFFFLATLVLHNRSIICRPSLYLSTWTPPDSKIRSLIIISLRWPSPILYCAIKYEGAGCPVSNGV